MSTTRPALDDFAHPPIRHVTAEDTARWLVLAWRDMEVAPLQSLAHGLLYAALGWLLTAGLVQAGMGSLVLPLMGTFLLVGPLAAVGLYEISRRIEMRQKPGLGDSLAAFRRNGGQLASMGVVLLIAAFVWIQLALLLFMLFFSAQPPALENFVLDLLASPNALPFLVVGTLVGGMLATLVFSISVVSLPMLMDRDVSVVTAISTSLAAVRANWKVMVGWAAVIVLLVGSGLMLFYVGLAVALPLVGHASWHAYRDLVV